MARCAVKRKSKYESERVWRNIAHQIGVWGRCSEGMWVHVVSLGHASPMNETGCSPSACGSIVVMLSSSVSSLSVICCRHHHHLSTLANRPTLMAALSADGERVGTHLGGPAHPPCSCSTCLPRPSVLRHCRCRIVVVHVFVGRVFIVHVFIVRRSCHRHPSLSANRPTLTAASSAITSDGERTGTHLEGPARPPPSSPPSLLSLSLSSLVLPPRLSPLTTLPLPSPLEILDRIHTLHSVPT